MYVVKVFTDCSGIVEAAAKLQPSLSCWISGCGVWVEKILRTLKKDPATEHIALILFSAANSLEKMAADIKADG